MKRLSRILALLMTMLFAAGLLAGCGGKSLKGKYTAVYDMKDYLNQGLGGAATVDSVNMEFYLDIQDGEKYHLYTDENQVKEVLTDAMSEAFEGVMTKDQVKDLIDQMDTSEFNKSDEGTYKVDGDKITFTSNDGSSQDGTIGGDGNITVKLKDGAMNAELVFKK